MSPTNPKHPSTLLHALAPAASTTTRRKRTAATPHIALPVSVPILAGPAPTVPTPPPATTPVAAPPADPAPSTTAGAPPVVSIPPVPAGFVAPVPHAYAGYNPSARLLAAAADAIANLQSFDVTVLGPLAPPPATLASALQVALGWRALRVPSAAWDAYVRAQTGLAWRTALTLLDELKPLFLAAVAKSPDLAVQYQGLAQVFDAPKQAAKKGLATRTKNAQTKAAAAAQTAAAPSASAAAPPAAPVKTVTVSV